MFYFVCILDVIASSCSFYDRVSDRIYLWARVAMFDLRGRCRHSGKCCRGIQIKYNGKWLNSQQKFEEAVLQNVVLTRFHPQFKENEIDSFNCSCLNKKNLCSSYSTRPNFCREYPQRVIDTGDTLYQGCGYTLYQRYTLPKWVSSSLKRHIWVFSYNNFITKMPLS